MSFHYTSGTAISIANWFTAFEAWITGTAGWTVSSGSGTQNLVITSSGEDGLRTKLFVNLYQAASPSSHIIYGEVQDDAGGTHKTTSNSYLYAFEDEDTPALFDYWIAADLDAIAIVFRRSVDSYYTAVYLGLVVPFAKGLGGDEYMMVSARPNVSGAVLRNYDGTWDVDSNIYYEFASGVTDPTGLDDFVYLADSRFGTSDSVVGQLKHVSGRIYIDEIALRDTVITGPTGSKTNWTVLGYDGTTLKFALRTGGVDSLGTDDEVGFKHTSGVANNPAAWFAVLESWLVGTVGWSVESGSGSQDIVFSSTGENGSESIFIRVHATSTKIGVQAYDDASGTHSTTDTSQPAREYYFPTQYYMSADKDCLCFTFNIEGDYSINWVGKFRPFDPNLPDTPRKVGSLVYYGAITVYSRVLRGHDVAGTWDVGINRRDGLGNTVITPSLFDINTHIMWPIMFYSTSAYGTLKYIYRLYGAISLMDTIQVGGRVYQVFRQSSSSNTYWCMRIQ